jgi:branched-chain amino acid transport system substrate-binding protein
MFSSAALPAAPVAKENKVVFIATISSHPELTSPGGYIYRVHTTDRVNANAAGRFSTRVLKLKKGGGLMASSDYGRSLGKFTQMSFEKEGGTWLLMEYFAVGSSDFRSQLTKIKEKDPEIIFIAATVKEAAQILRQMVELRMKMPVLGSSTLDDPLLVQLAGEATDMVYYHRVARAPGEVGKKREEAFIERYEAKFPGKKPAIAAKYYYDALGLACAAIKLGGETDPGIDQGMRKIKDYPGLTGNVTFDEIGDRIFTAEIVKIEKGKVVETGFYNSD